MRYVRADEPGVACPCCGQNAIDLHLIDRLNVCREYAGIPFVISSGFRCDDHNRDVGGSPTSSHLKGLAVDIDAEDSHTRFKILQSLLRHGFKRAGIYPWGLHCDIDQDKAQQVIWLGK